MSVFNSTRRLKFRLYKHYSLTPSLRTLREANPPSMQHEDVKSTLLGTLRRSIITLEDLDPTAFSLFLSFTESCQLKFTDAEGQKVPTIENVDVEGVPIVFKVQILAQRLGSPTIVLKGLYMGYLFDLCSPSTTSSTKPMYPSPQTVHLVTNLLYGACMVHIRGFGSSI